jgi:signal transduction histidine kinase
MTGAVLHACVWLSLGYAGASAIAILIWRRRRLRVRAQIGAAHRHAERERIARCLHDTLLQGMQALLIRLQAWERDPQIPVGQRTQIVTATNQMRALLIEGRDRIVMLRRSNFGRSDLVEALRDVAHLQAKGVTLGFGITVSGEEIPLVSGGFEHVLSIVKEAVVNAFRHADASRIEVTIEYRRSDLRVCVSDDGCGIYAPEKEAPASARHFGLLGMKERAAELMGQLDIDANGSRGTLVKLTVPAASVYAQNAVRPPVLHLSR